MRGQAEYHSVAAMGRSPQVSRSGFYAWRSRRLSARATEDRELAGRIQSVHEQSRGTYGAPRIRAELVAGGRHIACRRVAGLMSERGLRAVSWRKWTTTTKRDWGAVVAPDLVQRDFRAKGAISCGWPTSPTYLRGQGFSTSRCSWMRGVVAWSDGPPPGTGKSSLSLLPSSSSGALGHPPFRSRQPIHHRCFRTSLSPCRLRPSTGSVGDAFDNALCESFFATLECEFLDRVRLRNREEAEREVFQFIEAFYHSHRRHSSLNCVSPMANESNHLSVAQDTSRDLSTETG